MQLFSNDRTVRSNTIQGIKEFNSQSLARQAKKRGKRISQKPAIRKAFDLMGDDIFELSTENDVLIKKTGSYMEKWLEESKEKLLKQIDDENRAKSIRSRMKKQIEKH